MDLKGIMLSEVRKRKTDTVLNISLVCGITRMWNHLYVEAEILILLNISVLNISLVCGITCMCNLKY